MISRHFSAGLNKTQSRWDYDESPVMLGVIAFRSALDGLRRVSRGFQPRETFLQWERTMIVALAGGVGGAKMAEGLMHALPPGELTVIVNTADDFSLYGLRISPDIDTVLYTLGGIANPTTGWGIAGDTRNVLDAMPRRVRNPGSFWVIRISPPISCGRSGSIEGSRFRRSPVISPETLASRLKLFRLPTIQSPRWSKRLPGR